MRKPCADIGERNIYLRTLKLNNAINRIFNYHWKFLIFLGNDKGKLNGISLSKELSLEQL